MYDGDLERSDGRDNNYHKIQDKNKITPTFHNSERREELLPLVQKDIDIV